MKGDKNAFILPPRDYLILPFGAGFVEGRLSVPHCSLHVVHLILPFGAGFVEG